MWITIMPVTKDRRSGGVEANVAFLIATGGCHHEPQTPSLRGAFRTLGVPAFSCLHTVSNLQGHVNFVHHMIECLRRSNWKFNRWDINVKIYMFIGNQGCPFQAQ